MATESTGQDLIADFLETIRLRHLDRCREILSSLEALSEQQSEFKPWCQYLAGYLAFEQNHWAEAERIFTDLLQTDLEPPLRGRVFYALGRAFDLQGRWSEAITAFEQYLAIATQLGQVVEQARSWNHLALSYNDGFTKGDFGSEALQQAVAYGRSALEALEPLENPSPDIIYLRGAVWNTLGLIYVSLRQWDEAVACYEQDLAICQAQDDNFGMGITYGNLGEAYLNQGSWAKALAAHQKALNLIREFQGRYEEIDVLANMAFLYQKMAKAERALDHYRQTIELIEELRAGVSTEAVQAGFFATVVNIYANMILLCLQVGDQAQAFDYVERARSRAFLDTLLARSSVSTETIDAATMPLSAVQAALPDDALLLEYFTTGLVEAKESRSTSQSAERHRFPPAKTLLFAVTSTEIQVYDLGLSPNHLRPSHLNSVVERHFLKPDIRRRLYELLITPATKLLAGKRQVYLAPHGPLHYIPFQALIAPGGQTLLHKAGPQLIYAPSATLLLRYRPPVAPQVAETCLALGYNDRGAARLHFAEVEARGIARLTAGQALTGAAPKKATLYQQAANYRLLHFSCHGDFDPESPLTSALHIGLDETITGLDVLEHLRLRLRSGHPQRLRERSEPGAARRRAGRVHPGVYVRRRVRSGLYPVARR